MARPALAYPAASFRSRTIFAASSIPGLQEDTRESGVQVVRKDHDGIIRRARVVVLVTWRERERVRVCDGCAGFPGQSLRKRAVALSAAGAKG